MFQTRDVRFCVDSSNSGYSLKERILYFCSPPLMGQNIYSMGVGLLMVKKDWKQVVKLY